MPIYTDQVKRTIELPPFPKRIISLVPSQTELLFDIGLDDEVIGITKFCTHPDQWFRNKTRVGGTKTVDVEKIISLRPDLVIANKEENVKEQIEAIGKAVPVWISDVCTVETAFDMMKCIGDITGRSEKAGELVRQVKSGFAELAVHQSKKKIHRAAYLVWKDPYMAAGGDTFINDMLLMANCENIFADTKRYPSVTARELKERNTEIVLLSSEPYPFKQEQISVLQEVLPGVKIMLVDGEIFSWYGSRMKNAAEYLKHLFEY